MAEEEQNPEEVSVRLKPMLGLKPDLYVPIVYAILLAALLFFLLFLPGMRNNGTRIRFEVAPLNAAVFVDGNYTGYAPGEYFVPSGSRTITVSRPGFESSVQTVAVRGRLFGSLFVPRRESIRVVLEPNTDAAPSLLHSAGTQYAAWAQAGEATLGSEFPPVARALSSDLAALRPTETGTAADVSALWSDFVRSALPATGSEALLKDVVSGALGLPSATPVATPAGVAATLQSLADMPDAVAVQLADFVRPDREQVVVESPWHEYALASLGVSPAADTASGSTLPSLAVITAAGLVWNRIEPGMIAIPGEANADRGGAYPRVRELEPFFVSQTEIPQSLYQRFVTERPLWAPENRSTLVASGLVDERYLSEVSFSFAESTQPITELSAFAAAAFADWLDEQLQIPGTIRLPTEDEWDAVAVITDPQEGIFAGDGGPVAVSLAPAAANGIRGLSGNVWEWTTTPFAAYSHLYPPQGFEPIDYQRVVRGGGWATSELGHSVSDRGALPPSWTSPFVGIRLVLVAEE